MPGPGGGHVWPPWSFNPATGLVYIPSTIGAAYNYAANPDFKPTPPDLGPSGRGQMNMGTAFGAAARRGAAAQSADSGSAGSLRSDPQDRGNILVAWDPVAKNERWRGLAAGFNQGGTLSTAGNLVFSSVNTRLLAYRADTGEQSARSRRPVFRKWVRR